MTATIPNAGVDGSRKVDVRERGGENRAETERDSAAALKHLFFFFLFFFGCTTRHVGPGIEPMPLALEAQSLNQWTAREAPEFRFDECAPTGVKSADVLTMP